MQFSAILLYRPWSEKQSVKSRATEPVLHVETIGELSNLAAGSEFVRKDGGSAIELATTSESHGRHRRSKLICNFYNPMPDPERKDSKKTCKPSSRVRRTLCVFALTCFSTFGWHL